MSNQRHLLAVLGICLHFEYKLGLAGRGDNRPWGLRDKSSQIHKGQPKGQALCGAAPSRGVVHSACRLLRELGTCLAMLEATAAVCPVL